MPGQDASAITMADIYRFLSQSMHYPDASWLHDEYLSLFFALVEELGWHDDAAELRAAFDSGGDRLEPLQVEYTRLFINAVPQVVAPPYGSVYLSSDGMLYGPSAEKTLAFYRENGFDLASENTMPDHITHELEFLALLSQEGETAAEERFLAELFRPWFSLFRKRVVCAGQHPYYRVLVNLIDFFIREEQ